MTMARSHWTLCLALTAVFLGPKPSDGHAQDAPSEAWTSFRGSVAMVGVTTSTLPENPALIWKLETKSAFEATAAIAGKSVYAATMDGRLIAVDLQSGKTQWTYSNPDKDGIKSSPCVADTIVCYGDEVGRVRGIDRQTGVQKWVLETDGEVISSPTYIAPMFYVGSYDQSLYALDAATGQKRWQTETQGPIHASPTLVGDELLVAGCDGNLRFINRANGKETRAFEIGGNIASTPVYRADRIVVGTMSNAVLGVDAKQLTQLWKHDNPKRQFPFASSPAMTDKLAIIGGRDKYVYAFDHASGSIVWQFRTRGRVESSPVIAGDKVFVGSNDGTLYSLALDSGRKVWEFVAGPGISASPAVAQGFLVVGDQEGTLYCFGKK